MKDEEKLKKIAKEYLVARKKFRDEADKIPVLGGNDNIIGRIGEFIAVQFLEHKLKRRVVVKNKNMTQKGFDIVADDKRVSVKIITAENQKGRTTTIKDPWDELVVVELGEDSEVKQIGYIARDKFGEFFKERLSKGSPPCTSRSMFKVGGVFHECGKIFTKGDLGKYL